MRYSQIHFDRAGLPAGKEFLTDLLFDRVAARSAVAAAPEPERDDATVYRVSFRRDPALAAESFTLHMTTGGAEIAAADFRGTLYGAGEWLRALEYGEHDFAAPPGRMAQSPASPYRIAYFARHFHNWYEMATPRELEEYVEDLALWGINAIFTICIPVCQLTDDLTDPAFGRAVAAFQRLAAVAHRLDLMLGGAPLGGNQSFRNTPEEFRAVPNTDPRRGNLGFNLCWSNPAARAWFDAKFDALTAALGPAGRPDIVWFWPFDEGGCECEACRPWGGNGYLQLTRHWMARYRAIWPEVKFCLSTWTFHDEEWARLDQALHDGFRPDLILADAHEDYPRYPLEHDLSGIPVITFPEISMWGRHPWGGGGASPQPARFRRLFDQVAARAQGFAYYSEGLFEDINKILVQRFYWDGAPVGRTLESYARFYFPGCVPSDLTRLCALLEANHEIAAALQTPERCAAAHRRAAEALALVETMEAAMLPAMRSSWRWRLLRLRAVIDRAYEDPAGPNSPRGVAAMRELIGLYHCEPVRGCWNDPPHAWLRPPLP